MLAIGFVRAWGPKRPPNLPSMQRHLGQYRPYLLHSPARPLAQVSPPRGGGVIGVPRRKGNSLGHAADQGRPRPACVRVCCLLRACVRVCCLLRAAYCVRMTTNRHSFYSVISYTTNSGGASQNEHGHKRDGHRESRTRLPIHKESLQHLLARSLPHSHSHPPAQSKRVPAGRPLAKKKGASARAHPYVRFARKKRRTAASRIPTWSPTAVLTRRYRA